MAKNVPAPFETEPNGKVPAQVFEGNGRSHSTALNTARSDAVLLPSDQEHGGQPPEFDVDAAVKELPHWRQQITVRALLVGGALGVLFALVTLKLELQAGVVPGFGLASCMIGFMALRTITAFVAKLSLGDGSYFPQETTIMQTMATAMTDLPFSGGFAGYIVAMAPVFYNTLSGIPGINVGDAINPSFGKFVPYELCICMTGIIFVLHIRKAFIIDWGLPYPSSRAAGVLIKSMHSKGGAANVKRQLKSLGSFFCIAFFWDLFEWFFQGGATCTGGFANFPTFGLQGLSNPLYGWNFNFALTYPGIGLLVPAVINWSMLLGAIVVNGIVIPIAAKKEGVWYPAGLPSKSVQGIYAYAVFPTLGFFLAEGLYTVVKLLYIVCTDAYLTIKAKREGRVYKPSGKMIGRTIQGSLVPETPEEKAISEHVFIKGAPPVWWATVGYIAFTVLGTVVIPFVYKDAKWYYCLVAYLVAPLFAVINAYGAGLTDWNVTSAWTTLGICIISAWAGKSQGAVLGTLAVAGIFSGAVNASCSITGDFKTGYYTLTSPKAMFVTQVIGELAGVIVSPAIFFLYWKGGNRIGQPGSNYQVPDAARYIGVAGVIYEGIGNLPHNCLVITAVIFFVSIALCLFRDFGPEKVAVFMPSPIAMGIPGIVGAWVAVDMWVGGVIGQIWTYFAPESALVHLIPVATGLIAGEGVWSVPQAILSFVGATPPICMAFFKSGDFGAAAPYAGTG